MNATFVFLALAGEMPHLSLAPDINDATVIIVVYRDEQVLRKA